MVAPLVDACSLQIQLLISCPIHLLCLIGRELEDTPVVAAAIVLGLAVVGADVVGVDCIGDHRAGAAVAPRVIGLPALERSSMFSPLTLALAAIPGSSSVRKVTAISWSFDWIKLAIRSAMVVFPARWWR